jgi:DNA repair protein RecN (Recombination protein N)
VRERGGVLSELRVRDLGVIADLTLVLGPGMTALTGETGAGKTLVVEAIELLVGGRAESWLVRPGASEAFVEGRFDGGGAGAGETVLARVVPAAGRSRAYVDGRMAPVTALAETASGLVDLHGQHSHQSLLAAPAQRAALDAFAGVDLGSLEAARAGRRRLDDTLAAMGGDDRARAREAELLRFQLAELDAAAVDDPGEDEALALEEERLADVAAHREAASAAYQALAGEGAAGDTVGAALALVAGRGPFTASADRLAAVTAELVDVAGELRLLGESLEDDPERLEAVRARRQRLRELARKYGTGAGTMGGGAATASAAVARGPASLAGVVAFAAAARARLSELETSGERAEALSRERDAAVARVDAEAAAVASARRRAAPGMAAAVESHLRRLALEKARFEIEVGGSGPADEVVFRFGANPGEAVLPLSKVASGGELARVMLALRLCLGSRALAPEAAAGGTGVDPVAASDGTGVDPAPPLTLVFDEVDAGVGGEAALAVGGALAELARRHQVLVVTHLPQVAALADTQVAVRKEERAGRTVASAAVLGDAERVVEVSRMLSGQPASATARGHAEELLALSSRRRAG